MLRNLYSTFVVALLLGLTSWLSYRYFVIIPRNDIIPGGNEIAEMGEFGTSPRFRDAVTTYIENLKGYEALNFAPVASRPDGDGIAAALDAVLPGRLVEYPRSAEVVGRQPPEVISALTRHVALLIARCGGMPADDYLQHLGADVRFNIPGHSYGHFQWAMQTYLPDQPIPAIDAQQADLRASFDRIYAADEAYRSGSGRVIGFTTDKTGISAMVDEVPTGLAFDMADPLDKQLSPDEDQFLWGRLSLGDLVMTTPMTSPSDVQASTTLLRSSVCIVMKTEGKDIYPFHFNSVYDPGRKRWWLLTAERACSPRMAKTPPLVF